ncbi:putative HTLV-1-related endogenous sequence [Ananas comosus]|uniref:HTLV-1-related endogenous sequence n=1 Tax=Ananas comosus TaxID=4615 RepID=A0A6P5F6A7_ANACO|nr:putative HTLV-1-related endogenous sequence [Ananas comosus]
MPSRLSSTSALTTLTSSRRRATPAAGKARFALFPPSSPPSLFNLCSRSTLRDLHSQAPSPGRGPASGDSPRRHRRPSAPPPPPKPAAARSRQIWPRSFSSLLALSPPLWDGRDGLPRSPGDLRRRPHRQRTPPEPPQLPAATCNHPGRAWVIFASARRHRSLSVAPPSGDLARASPPSPHAAGRRPSSLRRPESVRA